MPKIPTFVTQARPTTEVGDVRSNIQISPSQNIGTAAEIGRASCRERV